VFTLKTSLTTNPSLSQLNNMWLNEQDCSRRKTFYDISQEDIVIDIPFTLAPPSLLPATRTQS
jgi:hypothetical protein